MLDKIMPLEIEGINDKIYSGFWSRAGANILDALIYAPIAVLFLFIWNISVYAHIFTHILNFIFMFWYNIYLPKKYGGTPGKLIIGIRIVKINSMAIGWKEAILRHSINVLFMAVNVVIMIIAVSIAEEDIYNNLSWLQKSSYLSNLVKESRMINNFSTIWVVSEAIILLTNKRRRALHDYIAGTAIVKAEYIEKIREKMMEISENNNETNNLA